MVDEMLLEKLEDTVEYRTYKKKYQIRTMCANIACLVLLSCIVVGGLTGKIGQAPALIGSLILCAFAVVLFIATMQAFGTPKDIMEGTVTAIRTRNEPTGRTKKGRTNQPYETVSYFVYQITVPTGQRWAKDACPELSKLRAGSPAIYFDMGFGNKYAVGMNVSQSEKTEDRF